MFVDKYLATYGTDIVLSNEPFIWRYDVNDSSIANQDNMDGIPMDYQL